MILSAQGISKSYKETKVLLSKDFYINQGEFVGIIGPSGSGKSTLLSILATLETSDSGKLFFDKRELTRLDTAELALLRNEQFGFVFQSSNLLMHFNAYDNIALPYCYGKKWSEKEKGTRIAYLANKLGITELLAKKCSLLSGGEQQRVAIARALAKKPRIVFADEPTGNLDAENSKKLLEFLRLTCKEEECSIIMVTHDPVAVGSCERVIEIDKL